MTARPRALVAILLVVSAPATAQVAVNRTTLQLFPTNVTDGRALWVNPAGLAVRREASIYADLAVRDPGANGKLAQVTLGVSTRGFSFGYQRDPFEDGLVAHTYRMGIAGSTTRFSAGGAIAVYRGETKGSGWDVGAEYMLPRPQLTAGVVARNLGQPTVRGLKQEAAIEPAATLRLWNERLALSALAGFTADSVAGYSFGAEMTLGAKLPVGLLLRADLDGKFRRTALTFGLSIGGEGRFGLVAALPGDAGGLDALDAYGVVSRSSTSRR